MAKKILIAVGAVFVLLIIVIATRPAEFAIERKTTINAPADVVFNQVNDFHQWKNWSPWEKLDPSQKLTFTGAETGTGAKYAWAGSDKVGEGNMEITHSTPPELVEIALNFTKPFEAHNITRFVFTSDSPTATTVTWVMAGNRGFLEKAMSLVMDMDKMVGPDFEKGLASMKEAAEADATKRAAEKAAADAAAAAAAPADADGGTADAGTK
ncbi:MAG: SRPBCC family protein [Archangium sp.]|nr:SRPBCC family protein [Archangium sp.]